MKLMSIDHIGNSSVAQLIDANLDRAREGLRVLEDWCRYSLHQKDLVIQIKDWRQCLGKAHLDYYKFARNLEKDYGLGLSHPNQKDRKSPDKILIANCNRVQEALRVLEEFCRVEDPELSQLAAKIRYKIYEIEPILLKNSYKENRVKKINKNCLYVITKSTPKLIGIVDKILQAGAGIIQYRCKKSTDLEMLSEANELSKICKKYGALLIVNDRVDLALAVGADGIHVGQNDLPTSILRKLIGEDMIIGQSTKNLDEFYKAHELGCDYLGVGPINSSETKPDLKPIGLDYASKLSRDASIPWFAIGGINLSNLDEILSKGVKKVAVSDAIITSEDPFKTTQEFLKKLT